MANGKRRDLLVNAAAGNGNPVRWPGGKTRFTAEATFGGGSVKLQELLPQGTWADVASGSLTAAGSLLLDLSPGLHRAVGTTASAIYASLVLIVE